VKILRSLPPAHLDQPCALTIGNFDGVHLGHQALVRTLVADAREAGLPAAVLTFELGFYPTPALWLTAKSE